jgi:membrane protein implicated in regulation of membrane protease activity
MRDLVITLVTLGTGALVLVWVGISVLLYGVDGTPSTFAGLFILGLACIPTLIGTTEYYRWAQKRKRGK